MMMMMMMVKEKQGTKRPIRQESLVLVTRWTNQWTREVSFLNHVRLGRSTFFDVFVPVREEGKVEVNSRNSDVIRVWYSSWMRNIETKVWYLYLTDLALVHSYKWSLKQRLSQRFESYCLSLMLKPWKREAFFHKHQGDSSFKCIMLCVPKLFQTQNSSCRSQRAMTWKSI